MRREMTMTFAGPNFNGCHDKYRYAVQTPPWAVCAVCKTDVRCVCVQCLNSFAVPIACHRPQRVHRAGGSPRCSALRLRRYRRAFRYKVSWPGRTCHWPHPHVLTYSLLVCPYSQSPIFFMPGAPRQAERPAVACSPWREDRIHFVPVRCVRVGCV